MRSTPKANVDKPAGGPGPAAPALVEPGVRAAARRERARDAAQDWAELERRLATEADRRGTSEFLTGAEARALSEAAGGARTANVEAPHPPASTPFGEQSRRESRGRSRRLRRLSTVIVLVLAAFVLGFAVSRISMRQEARPGERAAPAPELKLDRDASSFADRVSSPERERASAAAAR